MLRATVAGFEAATTLERCVGEKLFARGWHPTSVLDAIGAAVASVIVVDLDERALRTAILLAALQSSGTMAGFGSVGKPWQVGCAARDGVHAAAAERSLRGRLPDHLGGSAGVLTLMAGGAVDAEQPSAPSVVDTQFKFYSTCFGTHAATVARSRAPRRRVRRNRSRARGSGSSRSTSPTRLRP